MRILPFSVGAVARRIKWGNEMATVEIYTTMFCGFCYRAKRLLTEKGVEFVEYDLDEQPAKRTEMLDHAAGRRTVPQIFINGAHIGGSDDLAALEAAGGLDSLLAAAPPG